MNNQASDFKINSILKVILIRLILALILSVIILSYVPPVNRDELNHHLAIPKLYLKHGNIYEMPDRVFSYYPMNLDLLYMLPLYFGNDIIPKFIHFSFGLLTALLIFGYLKKRVNSIYGLFGVFLFLSIPVILKLSITVYVDLGLIFFSTASLIYLIKWIENNFKLSSLIISALWCGLAIGTKYNGLIVLFILTLFVPFIYSRSMYFQTEKRTLFKSEIKAIGYGILFMLIALAIFSPWMIRNYIWTHNPLFPLYNHLFNPETPRSAGSSGHFLIRSINFHESWQQILLIPVRIFFQGEDGNPKYFDGKLNPLLFFLPFFAFYRQKKGSFVLTEKKILLIYSLLFFFIAFFQSDMRIRYISPIIPPLVILSVFGLHEIYLFCRERYVTVSGKICAWGGLVLISAMLFMNIAYIYSQFKYVDPISYITGKISRDEYIEKYHKDYPVIQFANKNLPHNAKIFCIFTGERSYYSERDMRFDIDMFKKIIEEADSPKEMSRCYDQKRYYSSYGKI